MISAGVYPPYTLRGYDRLTWKYGDFIRSLDGTAVADVLGVLAIGFAYFERAKDDFEGAL